jgi:hypothetical protein
MEALEYSLADAMLLSGFSCFNQSHGSHIHLQLHMSWNQLGQLGCLTQLAELALPL